MLRKGCFSKSQEEGHKANRRQSDRGASIATQCSVARLQANRFHICTCEGWVSQLGDCGNGI